MEYELIRSERKTVEIKVGLDGKVTVRAPIRASKQYIDEFVLSKTQWIETAQEKMRKRLDERKKADLSKVRFLGKEYQSVSREDAKKVKFDGKRFIFPQNRT